jgi:hypothetical protein
MNNKSVALAAVAVTWLTLNWLAVTGLTVAGLSAGPASAQSYPSRPSGCWWDSLRAAPPTSWRA